MRRRLLCSRARAAAAAPKKLFHVPLQDVTSIGTSNKLLVRDFEITIREGERWTIVGPNGCGKSTTARLIGEQYCGRAPSTDDPDAAHIAFETHRVLLQDELREYRESRSDVTKLRATLSSYLFPEMAPKGPQFRSTSKDGTAVGFIPTPTRLAPLAVPYDATADDPLLADLEGAITSGEAGRLLSSFGLRDVRHRPVFAMSTGEARKMCIMAGLLHPPHLWVLDETFDGLDEVSRLALRDELNDLLTDSNWARRALMLVTHHPEEIMPIQGMEEQQVLRPTHGLLLGQGEDGVGYEAGAWEDIEPMLSSYFEKQREKQWVKPTQKAKRRSSSSKASDDGDGAAAKELAPIVEFKGISIKYNSHIVFDGLEWLVREGEKWVVLGGNGTGKSTIVELITGDNVLGYRQPVYLFGRKKGSGESVWSIKEQLGLLSTEFHMQYIDYADPSVRTAFRKPEVVTTWEVVCSGFFDSMGLYNEVSIEQKAKAIDWIDRFDLHDLVTPPPPSPKEGAAGNSAKQFPGYTSASMAKAGQQNFFHLSHGQQKLVLLCRAMVKAPRLLLLDEPTHGLSGHNKERLLHTLGLLADDPEVAVVYVTHRQEEVAALGFEKVLQLGASSSRA